METLLPNLLRAVVTDVMLILLLCTMATPRYKSKWVYALATAVVLSLNLGANSYFYLSQNYTAVFLSDFAFLAVLGVALKPLFADKIMQWCFSYLTMVNIYVAVVFLSYILSDVFPSPIYGNACLRFIFFSIVVFVFHKWVSKFYRRVLDYWHVYFFPVLALCVCFLSYFFGGDIQQMLANNYMPLIFLTVLGLSIYIAIIYSFKILTEQYAMREKNQKMQAERDYACIVADNMTQRLRIMEESVGQMRVIQHDQRHLSATLLELMQNGETDKAAALIQQQTAALPQKPARYCNNIAVNAAVSYYTEVAVKRGIRCDLHLDIPENLPCSELALSMVASNLMENAIHACEKLDSERERWLRATAVYTGQLILEVENPYFGEVTLDENGYPVTHEQGHGRGSESVSAFVKETGGEIFYRTENGIFNVRLLV